jgi:Phage terminase large subunit
MTTTTPTLTRSAALFRPVERRAYEPFGASRAAWRSARREVLMAGPADTGKSRGWLEKLHYCASKYPGMRACMIRKTRKSLTQSAMVTYEQKVLPKGALSERARPGRIHFSTQDQQYEYPNRSIIAVSGLDDPEKVKSSEWDMLYFQEATEGSLNDWEMLTRGLRNSVMPYQQLGGDCNASYPHHWLKARCDAGMTLMLHAHHEDNPSITPERLAVLQALTGVRYLRLYKGLWVAAEGVVYEEWNPAYHIVTREQLFKWQWFYTNGMLNRQVIKHIIGGVDWGWTNPGVIHIYGVDGDNRLLLLREVYMTRRTIDWWIQEAQALNREFKVEKWLPDPSRPDYIAQFEAAGLPCAKTNNEIALGIGFLRKRLADTTGDRPRYGVYEYALQEADPVLVEAHKPTGVTTEIEEYVWAEPKEGRPLKEEPVDENNHALDVARYVTMELDAGNDLDALQGDIVEAISGFIGY